MLRLFSESALSLSYERIRYRIFISEEVPCWVTNWHWREWLGLFRYDWILLWLLWLLFMHSNVWQHEVNALSVVSISFALNFLLFVYLIESSDVLGPFLWSRLYIPEEVSWWFIESFQFLVALAQEFVTDWRRCLWLVMWIESFGLSRLIVFEGDHPFLKLLLFYAELTLREVVPLRRFWWFLGWLFRQFW